MPDEKSSDSAWVSREEHERREQLHQDNLWAYVHAYARAFRSHGAGRRGPE